MAIILAGGKGTRLKPFTIAIPKPLLPLGEFPILEIVLRQLATAGFTRVVLSLGHLAHLFTALIGDGKRFGMTVEYIQEGEPLGTAGSLRLVSEVEEHVLVMNGDLLTTIDFKSLFDKHAKSGAAATIAVHRRQVQVDYGVVEFDANGLLSGYTEKPIIPYYVSMGVNVLCRQALEMIPPTGRWDMPDLMLALKNAGQIVACYETDCYWQDIGRFDDYQQATADFEQDPTRFLALE
jgi:NDP-sugar pyrophosphorylase family protein